MRLIEYLGPESIVPSIQAVRKEDVIRELATHLCGQLEGVSEADIVRVLMEREQLGSTAIGEGVAVPHAKLAGLSGLSVCLGRARRGVDFGAIDREPVYFFFVVLSPPDSAGAHLKLLARFSQVFRDGDTRARLRDAADAGAMYQIIAEQDAR